MSTSSLIHPVLNCVQILCVAQAENKPARCGGSEDKIKALLWKEAGTIIVFSFISFS